MKTLVGFSFTESLIQHLESTGLHFIKNNLTLKNGYVEYLCLLDSELENFQGLKIQGLEIREVHDEVLYFSSKDNFYNKDNSEKNGPKNYQEMYQEKRDFTPFEHNFPSDYKVPPHNQTLNPKFKLISILNESMEESELKLFLKLRKNHPLWALELQCTHFQNFIEQHPTELLFQWKKKPAALIHLGSSCFDLLIT